MNINITWSIDKLSYVSDLNGYTNVVKCVWWTVCASSGNLIATSNSYVELQCEDIKNFIALEYLSEEQVISWVIDVIGKDQADNYVERLKKRIEEMQLIEVSENELPWNIN